MGKPVEFMRYLELNGGVLSLYTLVVSPILSTCGYFSPAEPDT
jgi:hypothetical protein